MRSLQAWCVKHCSVGGLRSGLIPGTGEEQLCSKGNVATYNGSDKFGRAQTYPLGGKTLGGYSSRMVVDERFGVLLPESVPLEKAGPLMCAGVTLFDPLRRYGATKGKKVGIVGMGGLGEMGVLIAKALGVEVTAISRGDKKKAMALGHCGADHYLDSTDAEAMKKAAGSFDLLLNTIPTNHDYSMYTRLTARAGGKHILLGLHNGIGAAAIVDGLTFGNSRVKMSGISIGGVLATGCAMLFSCEWF